MNTQRDDLVTVLRNLLTEEQLDGPIPALNGKTARQLLTEVEASDPPPVRAKSPEETEYWARSQWRPMPGDVPPGQ